MAKFFSLALAVSISLAPGLAFAGPGPMCDGVAPIYNATTNASGLWFFNSTNGTSSGVDQLGGNETGSGSLPTLINISSRTAQSGSGGRWKSICGAETRVIQSTGRSSPPPTGI